MHAGRREGSLPPERKKRRKEAKSLQLSSRNLRPFAGAPLTPERDVFVAGDAPAGTASPPSRRVANNSFFFFFSLVTQAMSPPPSVYADASALLLFSAFAPSLPLRAHPSQCVATPPHAPPSQKSGRMKTSARVFILRSRRQWMAEGLRFPEV